MADEALRQGVQGITELIGSVGFINADFADVTSVMKDAGCAHFGIGRASGENRAELAAKAAIEAPLLETNIEGATGILMCISGNSDLSLFEVNEAAELVQSDENPKIEVLLTSLASRLQKVKGKKQYAYLPAQEKRLVDAIVDALSKDARIVALYDLWCQSREKMLHIYNESAQEHRPLSENETFRSIKNQIIQEALRREDFSANGSALRLLAQLAQMFQNDAVFQSEDTHRADRKLRRKLQEKKQAQGLKMEE